MYKAVEIFRDFAGDRDILGGELEKWMEKPKDELNEMIAFLFSKDFLSETYTGKLMAWNKFLLEMKKIAHDKVPENVRTDTFLNQFIRESFYPYLITREWVFYRQAYIYDPVLEEALIETEELQISNEIFKTVPYDCLYIEFHQDGFLVSEDEGVFVKIVFEDDKDKVYIYTLGSSGMQSKFTNRYEVTCGKVSVSSRNKFASFLLNALLYLCSQNAEVDALPLNPPKKTNEKIPKKESLPVPTEVDEDMVVRSSCGYRFGATVRMIKADPKRFSSPQDRKRGLKTPHMRRGHYHHYRTGKGRTKLELRWIKPTIIGSFVLGDSLDEIEAVIHKVC